MEELLEDKSTPIWVLQLARWVEGLDIVDAINGLETVQNALKKDFEKMVGEVQSS